MGIEDNKDGKMIKGRIPWKGSQDPREIAEKNAEARRARQAGISDNKVDFPNREGGYEEVAEDLQDELEDLIKADLTLHITNEEVEARQRLFLRDKDRVEMLKLAMEKSLRELPDETFYKDRGKIVFYLAAAIAFQELPAEEKAEQ